jgi:hypothetical protein
MSEQNTAITQTGLDRMISQFDKSTNLRELATSWLDRIQEVEDGIWPLLGERGISGATGDRLDGIGQILNLERGGLSDTDYRVALTAETLVLSSRGSVEDLLKVAQALIQMPTADYELDEHYPKSVVMRAVDHVLTTDPVALGTALQRTAPATTRVGFIYSYVLDASTFTLSSQPATVETSAALGLGAIPSIAHTWEFDSGLGAAPGAGEFRLNNADPLSATEMYIRQEDFSSIDASAYLDDRPGQMMRAIRTDDSAELYFFVDAASDDGDYYTLTIRGIHVRGTYSDGETFFFIDYPSGGAMSGVTPE